MISKAWWSMPQNSGCMENSACITSVRHFVVKMVCGCVRAERSHQNRPPGAPPRLAATMSARADLVASTKNAAAPIRDNITIDTDADAAPFSMYGLRQMLHRHVVADPG